MTRRHISTTERVRIFRDAGGRCHICAQPITVGDPWDVEHVIPLALGGADGGDNLAPAHVACHRSKTATDAGDTARAKRREAKHIGADAPSRAVIPGSKRSPWKRKLDGTLVRRNPDA